MSFDLTAIGVFGAAAVVYGLLIPTRWRGWALLVGSVVAVYWLQAPLPIRYSDYILPTATIALTLAIWWFTRHPEDEAQQATIREDRMTLAVIAALVIGMAFMRFVDADYRLTASRPPEPLTVFLTLAVVGAGVWGLSLRAVREASSQKRLLTLAILLIVGLFVLLKAEPLATEMSRTWRGLTGQDTTLAAMIDLNWLGFSYVAFRLIHTLRDRQTGLLPALSLREFMTYVIFFPAYTAGPIDRAERFVKDYRTLPEKAGLDAARWTEGGTRILIGLLKKFVIADSLAFGLALNPVNAEQAVSTPALWLLLYGYTLRLFFDFSGYGDIAIGLGILFGIKLPENFDRPYLKPDITRFWQSWHMTLSNWARFYVFTPLSRTLLARQPRPSPALVVLAAQMATMLTIGLWHGITPNFAIWGAWHGLALYVHKRWSDRTRGWYRRLNDRPGQKRLWTAFAWFITFHYVALGWVWFALPDAAQAARVLAGLFGAR